VLKCDEQLCKDLDAVYTDGRFDRFLEWVEGSLEDHRKQGDILDGNDLYRNQGKCIVLQEMLDAIHTSREHLVRIARNRTEGSAAE
jgi:hypothetical protein